MSTKNTKSSKNTTKQVKSKKTQKEESIKSNEIKSDETKSIETKSAESAESAESIKSDETKKAKTPKKATKVAKTKKVKEPEPESYSEEEEEFDKVESLTENTKFYQLHHIKDDNYKFSCVGFFNKNNNIKIELVNFNHEEYYCVISSNLVNFASHGDNLVNKKNNLYLFDMITMDVLRNDGKMFKIILSVEVTDPNFDVENKGNLMIWLHYKDKQIPLKTNLTHPSSDRLPYYIIGELKNEKIKELLDSDE